MTAHEVQLQVTQLRLIDVNIRESAKACINAVDRAALGNNLLDNAARGRDPRARFVGEYHVFFRTRNLSNLFEREPLAIQFDHETNNVRTACGPGPTGQPGWGGGSGR